MSSGFYMDVADLINSFGTSIKVWDASKLNTGTSIAGIPQVLKPDDVEPELRNDPILPYTSTSQLVQYLAGGNELQVDLLWISTGTYHKNTIVETPTQGGRFKVVGIRNYQDYSNATIYELKGDDMHQ